MTFGCSGRTERVMSQHTGEMCNFKYLSCMSFLSEGTFVTWQVRTAVVHSCAAGGGAAASGRVDRCNRDLHTCSVSCISKALRFSSAASMLQKLFPVHVEQLCSRRAVDSWLGCGTRVKGEKTRESHSLRSVPAASPRLVYVHCNLVLCTNLFQHVLRYVMRHMLL